MVAQDALVQSLVGKLFVAHNPFKIERAIPEKDTALVVDKLAILAPRDVYCAVRVLRRTVQHQRRVLGDDYILRLVSKVQPGVEAAGP